MRAAAAACASLLLVLAGTGAAGSGFAQTSRPDTTASYLEQLQRTDTGRYSDELLGSDLYGNALDHVFPS